LHASVYMNSKQAKSLATIRTARRTWTAFAATDIRFDRATVTCSNAFVVLRDFCDDPGKLVPPYARIRINRMSASKCMKITAAYSNGADPHQNFPVGGTRAGH
jgi:hypothetical protein